MSEKYLLSTAYFPPIHYMALVVQAGAVLIEREENYIKQTYRNRTNILSANGPHSLSVPILMGSLHKIPVKDIRIDYSKRWQQIHLRALLAAYGSSAFFDYYFGNIETVITENHKFLIDLNMHSLDSILKILNFKSDIQFTSKFEAVADSDEDYRYRISPKNKNRSSTFKNEEYYQVFAERTGFVPGLSVLDVVFNLGPDSFNYLFRT